MTIEFVFDWEVRAEWWVKQSEACYAVDSDLLACKL